MKKFFWLADFIVHNKTLDFWNYTRTSIKPKIIAKTSLINSINTPLHPKAFRFLLQALRIVYPQISGPGFQTAT